MERTPELTIRRHLLPLSLPMMYMFHLVTPRQCLDIGDQHITSTMRSMHHAGAPLGGSEVHIITTHTMDLTTSRGDIGTGITAIVHSMTLGIFQAIAHIIIQIMDIRTSIAIGIITAQAVQGEQPLEAVATFQEQDHRAVVQPLVVRFHHREALHRAT